jgi:mycothiol maleylpyruvate isomerase-like protein
MELFPAFERAVDSTAEIVTMTPKDRLDAPTPCTEWDARALLNHLIGTLWLAAALATPETRGPRIGLAIPVAADAPVTQRLVAFLGRRP